MDLRLKQGLKDGVPIVIGYFPIAMAFGILAKSSGLTFLESMGFSMIVFAGASQFIVVNMILLGSGFGEIVLATLLVNFRHFFMSASLASKIKKMNPLTKPLIGFAITDEVFSIASFAKGTVHDSYVGGLEMLAYTSWNLGTCVGFLVGSILPEVLQRSMAIGIYAMFVALLMPEIKKTPKAITMALMAGGVNSIFKFVFGLPQGWSVVLAIVMVSILGVVIYGKESEKVVKEVASHE